MIEDKITHPETGEILFRDIRPVEYKYKGESIIIDQPGWYPADKNSIDGVLCHEDMIISDKALKILKERVKSRENSYIVGNIAIA